MCLNVRNVAEDCRKIADDMGGGGGGKVQLRLYLGAPDIAHETVGESFENERRYTLPKLNLPRTRFR